MVIVFPLYRQAPKNKKFAKGPAGGRAGACGDIILKVGIFLPLIIAGKPVRRENK